MKFELFYISGAPRVTSPLRRRQSGPDTGNSETWETALQELAETAPLLPPEEGRVENPQFSFLSVPPLVRRPAAPTFSIKEQFPFPPSCKAHGLTMSDVLPPHFHPQHPLSPVAKRLRFGDATPLCASLASSSGNTGSVAVMTRNAICLLYTSPSPRDS